MFFAFFAFLYFFFISVITFEPIKQTRSAPQNDSLNFSFVKDIHVVGEKIARKGRKTALCKALSVANFGDQSLPTYMNEGHELF